MTPPVALRLLALLIALAGLVAAASGATEARRPNQTFRGGKVDWARLQSASPYWDRHANTDPKLLSLLRRYTSLNIGHDWQHTSADKVESLCRYPFLFADTIAYLSALETRNLAEYLRRGGFILIDACRNNNINPNVNRFLHRQLTQLRKHFPDLRAGKLQPEHEIFSIYFTMRAFPPFRVQDGQEPLYAVFAEERMIAVISLNGFQCVWGGHGENPGDDVERMQMVANIYIYAMTR